MIRTTHISDATAICNIYNYYVENTTITFEEIAVSVEDMCTRIAFSLDKYAHIVYLDNNEIVGYAYATTWRTREAYRFSTETTVYLKQGYEGKGIGMLLYIELIKQLKSKGFHLLIGCITIPNEQSIWLHEKLGFQKAGHFNQAGWKFNQWLDVGFWELTI